METAVNWLTEHGTVFFDTLSHAVEGFIGGFQYILTWIPFYVSIPLLGALAWRKAGKGTGLFTLLGLGLICYMGFWEETMQTLALVLSATCLALLFGIPWASASATATGSTDSCSRCSTACRPCPPLSTSSLPSSSSDWERCREPSRPSSSPCLPWHG